jgi:4-hydroxybenzoate polyprenyltransferase
MSAVHQRPLEPDSPPSGTLRAWLELLRAPNLLTVPGDPIAGFLLAAGSGGAQPWALGAVAAASLFFYAAGLLMNDLVDREIDREERPSRPLPSGRVAAVHVRTGIVTSLVVAESLAASAGPATAACGLLLMAAIVAYNLEARKSAVAGPACMGLCRGLSLALGASAIPGFLQADVLAAAGFSGVYIASVTHLARRDVGPEPSRLRLWLPAVVVVAGSLLFALTNEAPSPHEAGRPAGTFFVASAVAIYTASLAKGRSSGQTGLPVPTTVGRYIGALLPLQAAFAVSSGVRPGGLLAGLILLVLWPLNRIMARRFYAS